MPHVTVLAAQSLRRTASVPEPTSHALEIGYRTPSRTRALMRELTGPPTSPSTQFPGLLETQPDSMVGGLNAFLLLLYT